MKNIFKKNQMIITALAIMIAVAGYLNYSGGKLDSAKVTANAEADAEQFAEEVREMFPDADVDMHFGGQPIYYYVISAE